MQKVEIYNSMKNAKSSMEEHIESGWRIHTCTTGSYSTCLGSRQEVLVVYEK